MFVGDTQSQGNENKLKEGKGNGKETTRTESKLEVVRDAAGDERNPVQLVNRTIIFTFSEGKKKERNKSVLGF